MSIVWAQGGQQYQKTRIVLNTFRNFLQNRSGNYAIIMGVVAVPILLAVGFAVDYSRASTARSQLQAIADASALAMASSKETDRSKLEAAAERLISANYSGRSMDVISVANLENSEGKIDLELVSTVPTTFMHLAGIDHVDINARAIADRVSSSGPVEIAFVLDNTYSMSETDVTGKKKLDVLREAAKTLIATVMAEGKTNAKIAVVPYADYVTLNTATTNRKAPWLDVPDDYTPADWCDEWIVVDTCKRANPKPCTRYEDGKPYSTNDCGCAEWAPQQKTPRVPPICYPQKKRTWFGCVGSRTPQAAREDDILPTSKYPGYVDEFQRCPTPILPLTDNKNAVIRTIDTMNFVYRTLEGWEGVRPNTYLPSGLTWGLNVLTPTAPFTETTVGTAEVKPRQVLILMTDGENTMALNEWNKEGRVYDFAWYAVEKDWPTWKAKTDGTTRALCQNIKQNHQIEIYSVAFMVRNDPASKKLLEDCSSDKKTHYFDANNSSELWAAFEAIGNSLSVVRLVR